MTTKVLSKSRAYKKFKQADMPALNFTHIRSLTDDTGMIQHALFSIPNRKEGYCIDDNARALLLMVMTCKLANDKSWQPLLQVYLSFIHYMQTPDGEFKNFMSYTKHAHEDRGSEDSFGRTIMALGYLANEGPSNMLCKTGADLFSKAYNHIDKLTSLRGIAGSIIGVCHYIKFNYPDHVKTSLVANLASKMLVEYKANRTDDWQWFEPILTYDNAMLPLALLHAYEVTSQEEFLDVALEAMAFLESEVCHDGMISPVGNDGWHKKGKPGAKFDQQGIDAMAMVLYYQQAHRVTRDEQYLQQMYTSYQWFLGNNDLNTSLYHAGTGGCADGLHSTGVNQNQGAESTLSYWISHMAVLASLGE